MSTMLAIISVILDKSQGSQTGLVNLYLNYGAESVHLVTMVQFYMKSKHWQHWKVDCLEMVLNGDLRLFHLILKFLQFKQTVQTLIRSAPALFDNVPNVPVQILEITLYQQHLDVTATRIAQQNNSYLDSVWRAVWLHWSMIITWATTRRKFMRLYTMTRL